MQARSSDEIMSVRLSVYQTRDLWRNGKNHCIFLYDTKYYLA